MKQYDLEARTEKFALDVRSFLKTIPATIANTEDGKQLIRSSGSVAANYIEANESLGKKDFLMRMRIARKEAKESVLWLRLLSLDDQNKEEKRKHLMNEGTEILKIMSSIINKSLDN